MNSEIGRRGADVGMSQLREEKYIECRCRGDLDKDRRGVCRRGREI